MTYVTELDTSILVALARAEVGAHVLGHLRRCGGSSGQSTSICSLSNASDLCPSGNKGLNGSHEARSGLGGTSGGSGRTSGLNGVASGESGKLVTGETDILVDNLRVHSASMGRILVNVGLEDLASIDVSIHVVAVVDGILKDIDFPSRQEVGMELKAIGVAGREDVGAIAPVRILVDWHHHLVEDTDSVNRMRRGAGPAVVVVDGVGHVRLVVGAVEVDAVPALGEEYLPSNTVFAGVDVREVDIFTLSVRGVVRNGSGVVYVIVLLGEHRLSAIVEHTETDEAHGLISEAGRVVGSAGGATSNHLLKK